jgi:hypothetical protein
MLDESRRGADRALASARSRRARGTQQLGRHARARIAALDRIERAGHEGAQMADL